MFTHGHPAHTLHSLPVTTATTITHLEDTFTEQVQVHHQHLLSIQHISITVFHEFKYTNDSVRFMLLYCLILLLLVLFCLFDWFCSILLKYVVLFYSTRIWCFFSIVFHSSLFNFYFPLHSVLFYFISFYSVLFNSNMLFCSLLFYSIMLFCSVLLYSILVYSNFIFRCILFHFI